MVLLEATNLTVAYGSIRALVDVSFEVHKGEIVALIGPNGAGKSTVLRTISGLVRPKAGFVTYSGPDSSASSKGVVRLDQLKPHEIVRCGIVHVPEGRQVFQQMTVMENLEMGAYTVRSMHEKNDRISRVVELFPRLGERRGQLAGSLSGGEQQMLAIGRALVTAPVLMMLDEPSLGLAPKLVEGVMRTIEDIRDQGITVILVEQNAIAALGLADRGYVLEACRIVAHGKGRELMNREDTRRAYLGY